MPNLNKSPSEEVLLGDFVKVEYWPFIEVHVIPDVAPPDCTFMDIRSGRLQFSAGYALCVVTYACKQQLASIPNPETFAGEKSPSDVLKILVERELAGSLPEDMTAYLFGYQATETALPPWCPEAPHVDELRPELLAVIKT